MRRRPICLFALVLALAACSAPPPAAPAAKPRASTAAAKIDPAKGSQVPGAGGLVPVGGSTVADGLASVSLAGTVRVPAGVLTNNAGNFVGNNGGGIVANNAAGVLANHGAGYRLAAVDQAPLAGAKVYVLDAQGRTVAGKDGKPLYAETDAQGRYAFTGALPAHNFVLAVELADGKGRWQAVLPKDAADRQAIDLDLISTLTTGYILGKYVDGQADAQATLDKLPALAEADARGKAGAAFDKANRPVPGRFDRDTTLPLFDALRQQDPALDAQMEAVKRLLIAAGQSDFGNGQPAVQVRFDRLQAVLPQPDGTLWLCSEGDRRIWAVDAEGRLRALAGTGVKGVEAPTGQVATKAALAGPTAIARDEQGRLLIADADRLLRVDADGTIAVLATGLPAARALFATGPDAWSVVDATGGVTAITPGVVGQPQRAADATGALRSAGLLPGAQVALVFGSTAGIPRLLGGLAPTLPGQLLGVAPDGTWVSLGSDGSLIVTPPGGAPAIFGAEQVAKLPAFAPFDQLKAKKLDANGFAGLRYAYAGGTVYVASAYEVHALAADGAVRHVAGLDPGRAVAGTVTGVALDTPTGVAIAPDGTLYLADNALKQVLERDATGGVTRVAGVGGAGTPTLTRQTLARVSLAFGSEPPIEFGATYAAPAASARLVAPSLIRADAQGRVMVLDMNQFLRRVEADGQLKSLYDAGVDGGNMADYVPQADGAIMLALAEATGSQIARLRPDGRLTTLVEIPQVKADPLGEPLALAAGADGAVYVLANDQLSKLGVAKLEPLIKDARLAIVPDRGQGTVVRMAVDAGNRIYVTAGDNLLRWTPGATSLEVLAGPGGKLLAGFTADDSLQDPMSPVFGPDGDLYVVDRDNKQIKRIPKGQL